MVVKFLFDNRVSVSLSAVDIKLLKEGSSVRSEKLLRAATDGHHENENHCKSALVCNQRIIVQTF